MEIFPKGMSFFGEKRLCGALPIFAGRDAGVAPEEFGEVEFRRKFELRGDFLDAQRRIGQKLGGAGEEFFLQVLFRGDAENGAEPAQKRIGGTAEHRRQRIDARLRRCRIAQMAQHRFEGAPRRQIRGHLLRPVHPADVQGENLAADEPFDRIRLPENGFAFAPELRAVDDVAGAILRENAGAGKDFEPEMNAQVLVGGRVQVAPCNAGQQQADIVYIRYLSIIIFKTISVKTLNSYL